MENFPLPPTPSVSQLMRHLKKGKILRYKIDIFSVIAVIVAVTTQFFAFWYRWPWYTLPLIIILMRTAHLAEHNHAHLSFFYNPFLNEFTGWLMFLNCGIPLQSYREQHIKVHHACFGTPKDWTSPWDYKGTDFPGRPINKYYYYASFMLLSILQCTVIYLRNPRGENTLKFTVSFIIVGMVMTALALHDLRSFLIFYGVPWIMTYIYLAIASWGQHVNCEYDSIYTSAINDLNPDSGLLGFNIGYHTAHHWHPGLHWSLLEEFHNTYCAPAMSPRYYAPPWFSRRIVQKIRDKLGRSVKK